MKATRQGEGVRRGRGSGAALVAVLVSLTGVVSACGNPDREAAPSNGGAGGARISSSLAALMDRELAKKDLSAPVRAILERSRKTGSIAANDYEAAFANYSKCVKNAGVSEEYKKLASGIYQVIPNYSTASEAAGKADFDKSNACGMEHLAAIEVLYTLQVGNPDLLADGNEVATRCLIKADLAKADFTAEAFKQLADKNFEGAPFDTSSPAFTQCLANAGMAFAGKP